MGSKFNEYPYKRHVKENRHTEGCDLDFSAVA